MTLKKQLLFSGAFLYLLWPVIFSMTPNKEIIMNALETELNKNSQTYYQKVIQRSCTDKHLQDFERGCQLARTLLFPAAIPYLQHPSRATLALYQNTRNCIARIMDIEIRNNNRNEASLIDGISAGFHAILTVKKCDKKRVAQALSRALEQRRQFYYKSEEVHQANFERGCGFASDILFPVIISCLTNLDDKVSITLNQRCEEVRNIRSKCDTENHECISFGCGIDACFEAIQLIEHGLGDMIIVN